MPFRIHSVLVATDMSASAAQVLRSASALAALTEAELHVIHAAEPDGLLKAPAADLDDARALLDETLNSAIPASAEVTSVQVEQGRAHRVILDRASDVAADLIVIGPHRARSPAQALGTTADRLVRTTDVPLLIVQDFISLPLSSVLVPTDLSDAAQGAMDVALVWSAALRQPQSSGQRTTVTPLLVAPTPQDAAVGQRERIAAAEALNAQVTDACERTACAPSLDLVEEVAEGDPAEEILRRASAGKVDLLVLGTHGHGGLSRALIGSVSSVVARRAECPRLLVPPGYWQARREREARVAEVADPGPRP